MSSQKEVPVLKQSVLAPSQLAQRGFAGQQSFIKHSSMVCRNCSPRATGIERIAAFKTVIFSESCFRNVVYRLSLGTLQLELVKVPQCQFSRVGV